MTQRDPVDRQRFIAPALVLPQDWNNELGVPSETRRSYALLMSFSANKRDALDVTMPVAHRMSHLRSCAVLVAEKYRVPRSIIIERVARIAGVDITQAASDADIERAAAALQRLNDHGVHESDSNQ